MTETDVCIVGAGAGGATVAKELSESGLKVVVLEAGSYADRSRIPTARKDWELHAKDFLERDRRRDRIEVDAESRGFRVARHRGVGGSTMHMEGLFTRMHPEDFHRYTHFGVSRDWPLPYSELQEHYSRAESVLGLSGRRDNPFEPSREAYPNPAVPMSCAVRTIARASRKLGLHPAHAPLAILTRPERGRGACNHCGGCWFGCVPGAISNAAQTYIPLALSHGAEIRTNCVASRILTSPSGDIATGVEYLDAKQALRRVRCRAVVVAGNAVETARLLLLSESSRHPDGLANSSGLVGRNFMGHVSTSARGLLQQRVDAYKGPNINGMIQDYYDWSPDGGYQGGFLIALRNAELGPVHFYRKWARRSGLRGEALMKYVLANFGHSVNIIAFGETLPNEENRVELSQEKDPFGLPRAKVHILLSRNEQQMQQHMREVLVGILEAAGAEDISSLLKPHPVGSHLMGTCRMGVSPEESVTDSHGRCHDLKNLFIADGSLFPTSTPANPTLTIHALATRVAQGVTAKFQRRDL